ncbi:DUF551 domain-containing protein [Klebsiella pneumoniae]|uniref:DUF551 domain-containing protein n=1 Tax=Klebsiella pneumoniae TaxID=573 RepID=A0A5D3JFL6_KLEPN|nr:DUF551 domain-containing protein [Klebsiella pneumoniae]ASC12261.1 hypothetical protein AM486_16045 [Klebsiella pneumoniae]NER54901.1 DUF551 domain-containing protein [Klebsiella pneumoniae]NEW24638.1 DUF551 domain-containing protein [Klebsiella pneumoniae]NPC25116.1 DUF551 domain-containing protein [Klebsiella pneumoniae]TYL73170.1 DUF551 domain-containing protein [Klebsiella pneumoniae]
MSEFSRETLLNIIETDHVQCGDASALARMALAAMDSEPVIIVGDDGGDALSYRRLIQSFAPGTKLYRHAQPAPVVPGKWIPVSERMPEIGDIVLTAMGGVVNVGETECSAANCRFFTSVISGRELPATHWMPLPAAPQEVNRE